MSLCQVVVIWCVCSCLCARWWWCVCVHVSVSGGDNLCMCLHVSVPGGGDLGGGHPRLPVVPAEGGGGACARGAADGGGAQNPRGRGQCDVCASMSLFQATSVLFPCKSRTSAWGIVTKRAKLKISGLRPKLPPSPVSNSCLQTPNSRLKVGWFKAWLKGTTGL